MYSITAWLTLMLAFPISASAGGTIGVELTSLESMFIRASDEGIECGSQDVGSLNQGEALHVVLGCVSVELRLAGNQVLASVDAGATATQLNLSFKALLSAPDVGAIVTPITAVAADSYIWWTPVGEIGGEYTACLQNVSDRCTIIFLPNDEIFSWLTIRYEFQPADLPISAFPLLTLFATTPTPVPHCSDGFDNDGDGWTDFPDDPQCGSELDPSESAVRHRCGLGQELALLVPLLLWGRRRRARR